MDSAVLPLPKLASDNVVPHTVREFGIEARKAGKAWETAFNGPIHEWTNGWDRQRRYLVTARIARIKDQATRELFSTNLLFLMFPEQMSGMHNIYDLAQTNPFIRIRGPRTPAPTCPARPNQLWYDANPEGVIMEDIRQTPTRLPSGRPGFFVTGQGYRGKVMLPNGKFIHDVGVYGGYLDPSEYSLQLELSHLFGGVEFVSSRSGTFEDEFLKELGANVWVRGIVGDVVNEMHVESFKNSVRLPTPLGHRHLIGARSMSETKLLYYFETNDPEGLSGYRLAGFIDGLPEAIGKRTWETVNRVGLGSNFVDCPELDGWIGFIHVVLEKNNSDIPETLDPEYPEIEEQYEGWVVLLKYDERGCPYLASCVRAVTPDDVPHCYHGRGELFETKRVAFPISLYRSGNCLALGYGWGDRALFLAEFDYQTVVRRLGT